MKLAHHEMNLFGHKLEFSASMQFAALSALLFIAIYAVLFTAFPSLHDGFHEFRHSFGIIPCH
ncbi:CbtB-domain containing protein [Candidatus Micrarchaeota archaeon]|nr:CbtB-domain containing protein [Candidatus Micrarchaeota archaeon]